MSNPVQFNKQLYPSGFRSPSAVATSANSTYSGSTLPATLVPLCQVAGPGSYLRKLYALPNALPSGPIMCQLFKWNGSNLYFARRALMPQFSSMQGVVETDFGLTESYNLMLGNEISWYYYVGIDTALAAGVTFCAEVEDMT